MLFQFCHQGHVFSPCDKTLFWIKESLSGLRIVCLHRTSKTGQCHVAKATYKGIWGRRIFSLCIKTASRAARQEQISAYCICSKRCNSTIILQRSSKSPWNGNCNRFLYGDLYLSKKASQTRQTVGQDLILSTGNRLVHCCLLISAI